MALSVSHVAKEYPTRSGSLRVLDDIDLSLNPGEAVAVMGPSGSGKTTLLQILGTLDRPTSGSVALDGVNPFALSEADLADYRNRRIGFVFQDHHLLPQCSVLENVLIPSLVCRDLPGDIEKWARELLDRVGLGQRLEHRPAELSGGERQRVALARALILRPRLLLADEPTGNLDHKLAREIGQLLLDLHKQEQTILVVVTHSPELAAMLPKILRVNAGRLVAEGTR